MRQYTLYILLAIATAAHAQIDSVLASIERNNMTLKALAHNNQAQVLDAKSENVLGGPTVEYSPFYTNGYTGIASSELVVSEEIDFPTRYAQRNKQTRLKRDVLDGEYAVARNNVLLEAQLLCLDIVRLNQLHDIYHQRLSQSETMLGMFEKRMEAGDVNILELNKVRLECMQARQALAQNETERMETMGQLQVMNGGEPLHLHDKLFPERELTIDCESFVRTATAANADVASALAAARATDYDVSVSKSSWLPSLTVGFRRNTEMREGLNGFIVGASFPLLSTSSRVKAARQRQQGAQLQLDEARLQAESSLRTLYREITSLRSALDHTDTVLLCETLGHLDKALLHGEISALQYYAEVNDIYSKLEAHIELHCRYSKLMAELYRSEL